MPNYTVFHLHSQLSNGVTNIDSVTDYHRYIEKAQECGMTALGFSEHGSVFGWLKKKEAIEKAGMKYIHAEEFYLTETLEEKIRDNYHIVLIARNKDGKDELNHLSSTAFNREDGHYYYAPRITFDELAGTSDNIIISTACLASPLSRGTDTIREKYINFLRLNKDRCFLEIQHHNVDEQRKYNRYLKLLSDELGIPLIAGTDTHALDDRDMDGRAIMQYSKDVHFANEDNWDLTFKTYDQLVAAYKKQDSLPMDAVLEAIENTNRMADMVEEFSVDRSYKYPKLWEDPVKTLDEKIALGIKRRGITSYPNYSEYLERIATERDTYIHNGAVDFMLLMADILDWCREHDILVGYGRGSVNGSVIAWLLGITEMDSIKFRLNYQRFMSLERISLAD